MHNFLQHKQYQVEVVIVGVYFLKKVITTIAKLGLSQGNFVYRL